MVSEYLHQVNRVHIMFRLEKIKKVLNVLIDVIVCFVDRVCRRGRRQDYGFSSH